MLYRTDFEKFQKQDNTAILEFLSSAASVLASVDAISQKESGDLRISFRNTHRIIHKQDTSILRYLADEKNDFLTILLNRYGVVNLSINLFRFTIRPYINQYNETLSRLGIALIDKADLFFNRLFGIYIKDACESKLLFSGVVIRFASFLEKTTRAMEEIINPLSKLYPSNMILANEIDDKIDHLMAKHLGFTGIEQDFLPYFTEKCLKIQLAESFLSLVTACEDFLIQFKHNCYEGDTSSMELYINWIKGECGKLFSQDFIASDNLHQQEIFRRNLCGCLFTIMDAFKNLADEVIALLTPSCFSKNERFIFSDDIRRRVASDLVTKEKVSPTEAQEASHSLLQYCTRFKLNPSDIIQGELTKIHPTLTFDALKAIQTAQSDDSLASTHSEEKIIVSTEAKKLTTFFNGVLKKVLPILIASLFVSVLGCGIKTAPRSSIEDFRPDLPSHPVVKDSKSSKDNATEKGDLYEKK